jgi:hypothetical protein
LILALIVAVTVIFEIPSWKNDAKPKVFSKGTEETERGFKIELNVGKLNASNNISTSTTSTYSSFACFASRTILLKTNGTDELLTKVAENIARSLSKISYVTKVEYYPDGSDQLLSKCTPDVTIVLSMLKKKEIPAPSGRKLSAVFNMDASDKPFKGVSSEIIGGLTPPQMGFTINSTLDHNSNLTGYESRQAKYKQQAENIAQQFTKAIEKQFKIWKDKYGLMPELPEVFYGKQQSPPDFDFLKGKEAEIVISRSGLLINNHTIWRYNDIRPTKDVLNEILNQLEADGWTVSDNTIDQKYENSRYLRMRKERRGVYVFRQRKTDPQTGKQIYSQDEPEVFDTPIVFHYKNHFSDNQFMMVRQYLLESDTDIQTLLMFKCFFNSCQDRKALSDKLDKNKGLNFDAHLYLAQYYQQQNETEKAKNSLLNARALAYTVKEHSPRRNDIKELAKKLGDEKLADLPIGVEVFRHIGFIDANSLDQPYEVEKKLGQAVSFYYFKQDGTLRTCTFRVVKDESDRYAVEDIQKEKGTSSVGQRGGRENADGWMYQQTIGSAGNHVELEIRITPQRTFKYKAQKSKTIHRDN